jgi:hypothetical protein
MKYQLASAQFANQSKNWAQPKVETIPLNMQNL